MTTTHRSTVMIPITEEDQKAWRKFARALAIKKEPKDWKLCWFVLLTLKKKGYISEGYSEK